MAEASQTTESAVPLSATSPQDIIEAVEEDRDLAASDYENTTETDSMSMTSSKYDFPYENGRSYHSYRKGRYPLPNNDTEQNRDDMKHEILMELTDGKLRNHVDIKIDC